jgi:hypothetical protein
MISPEIWRDKKVVRISDAAFIVWIGCITMADDEGIIEPDAEGWFYEFARRELSPEKIQAAFGEVVAQGMVILYGSYGFIPSWYKHQVLNRPSKTKLVRPPRKIVERFPDYIEAWRQTFTTYEKKGDGTREKHVPDYPFNEHTVNEPELFTEDSLRPHPERKGREEKGKEEKRIIIGATPATPSAALPRHKGKDKAEMSEGEKELYHLIQDSFEGVGGPFADYRREGPAIKRIVSFAARDSPTDPKEFIRRMLVVFKNLTESQDRYWSGQPFIPSVLASGGIWPRVKKELEKAEGKVEGLDESTVAAAISAIGASRK